MTRDKSGVQMLLRLKAFVHIQALYVPELNAFSTTFQIMNVASDLELTFFSDNEYESRI